RARTTGSSSGHVAQTISGVACVSRSSSSSCCTRASSVMAETPTTGRTTEHVARHASGILLKAGLYPTSLDSLSGLRSVRGLAFNQCCGLAHEAPGFRLAGPLRLLHRLL